MQRAEPRRGEHKKKPNRRRPTNEKQQPQRSSFLSPKLNANDPTIFCFFIFVNLTLFQLFQKRNQSFLKENWQIRIWKFFVQKENSQILREICTAYYVNKLSRIFCLWWFWDIFLLNPDPKVVATPCIHKWEQLLKSRHFSRVQR